MSDRSLKFEIRPLKVEDSDPVFRLKQESTRALNNRDYTPEQIEALCGGKLREYSLKELKITDSAALFVANFAIQNTPNNFSSIVAYLEDKIIGYAFIQVDNLSWINNATLFELYVHPEYIRLGVGTKLLQNLEVYAKKQDCKVILVGASLTALPFYKSRGYQIIERGSYFCCGVKIPVVFMQKWTIEPTEIEKTYWQTAEEFYRNAGWLFTKTGLSRQTFS